MITLNRKQYINEKDVFDQVEFPTWQAAYDNVHAKFVLDQGNVVSFEEKHFANGVKTLELKNREHKILYQLKHTP